MIVLFGKFVVGFQKYRRLFIAYFTCLAVICSASARRQAARTATHRDKSRGDYFSSFCKIKEEGFRFVMFGVSLNERGE